MPSTQWTSVLCTGDYPHYSVVVQFRVVPSSAKIIQSCGVNLVCTLFVFIVFVFLSLFFVCFSSSYLSFDISKMARQTTTEFQSRSTATAQSHPVPRMTSFRVSFPQTAPAHHHPLQQSVPACEPKTQGCSVIIAEPGMQSQYPLFLFVFFFFFFVFLLFLFSNGL